MSEMQWEVEELKKVMDIGEKIVWGTNIKTFTLHEKQYNTDWKSRNIYFTDKRILYNVKHHMPEQIPYRAISKMGQEPPGSGGFAGVAAVSGGGGVIVVMSTYATISLQFQDRGPLQYANWLLNAGMRGEDLQTAEGIPNIVGEKDPNAPPPAPAPSGGGACFIATAAYGTALADEVNILRKYRDQVLQNHALGRQFIATYYAWSPPIARRIEKSQHIRKVTRLLLKPIVSWVKRNDA